MNIIFVVKDSIFNGTIVFKAICQYCKNKLKTYYY